MPKPEVIAEMHLHLKKTI